MDLLTRIEKRFRANPALRAFTHFVGAEPSLLIEETWDAVKATLLWLMLLETEKSILVLSSGSEDALFQDCEFFCPHALLEFPALDTFPGDGIAPSMDLVGQRSNTLAELKDAKHPHILFASLHAVLHKLPDPMLAERQSHTWKQGDTLAFANLPQLLQSLGFSRKVLVEDKGEFALRGGIIDLFPAGSPHPFRLEFFGDVIEEIRIFDPASQKTIEKRECVQIAHVHEQIGTHSLFDYMPHPPVIVFNDIAAIEETYVQTQSKLSKTHFFSFEEFLQKGHLCAKHFLLPQRIEALSSVRMEKRVGRGYYTGEAPLQPLHFQWFQREFCATRWEHPFSALQEIFGTGENRASLSLQEILQSSSTIPDIEIVSPSEKECALLSERSHQKNIRVTRRILSGSYALVEPRFALISTLDLGQSKRPRRQQWRDVSQQGFSDFHAFAPGDLVVHFQHGIAKFHQMLTQKNHVGEFEEYLELEFANKSKLYVPLSQSYLVSRYVGTQEETPMLSELGTKRWQHTLMRAQRSVEGYAQQLLEMHAQRSLAGGHSFPEDSKAMELFEADFPFHETKDQVHAIDDVKRDMQQSAPMDRLICGDVGYGKTEVAIRAAFKACYEGKKQVAVLVPTTLLALQHYETFKERMSHFPIRVALLSRLKSPKEQKTIVESIASGQTDIIIGTHRLLSSDVVFDDLGLVVIDEEQRFGVRAKERIKHLKAGIDCLTLSATPIPRTLYLALMGSREISTIYTPPQDRLPIKTMVVPRSEELLLSSLERELARGGQAFFIHNRIESIYTVGEEVQKLLPQARIAIAHGQLDPIEVDSIFHAFKSGEADILISTTLIENGVDVPNANTILVDRAHTFGLADLYQMRGRVGRWNRPAFAYFLTPQKGSLSDIAHMRLQALISATGLGAGMKVAMRDLEIRGAGDILGVQQSGHVSSIGFHLYCRLLKKTMEILKQKKTPQWIETKLEYTFKAQLPEGYVPETSLRIEFYHRLGNTSSMEECDQLETEIRDRFGPLPETALWLIHLMRLKTYASLHHFSLLRCEPRRLVAKRQALQKSIVLPHTREPKEYKDIAIGLLQKNFVLH